MAVMTKPAVLCVCITNLIDVLLPVLLIRCKTLVKSVLTSFWENMQLVKEITSMFTNLSKLYKPDVVTRSRQFRSGNESLLCCLGPPCVSLAVLPNARVTPADPLTPKICCPHPPPGSLCPLRPHSVPFSPASPLHAAPRRTSWCAQVSLLGQPCQPGLGFRIAGVFYRCFILLLTWLLVMYIWTHWC